MNVYDVLNITLNFISYILSRSKVISDKKYSQRIDIKIAYILTVANCHYYLLNFSLDRNLI